MSESLNEKIVRCGECSSENAIPSQDKNFICINCKTKNYIPNDDGTYDCKTIVCENCKKTIFFEDLKNTDAFKGTYCICPYCQAENKFSKALFKEMAKTWGKVPLIFFVILVCIIWYIFFSSPKYGEFHTKDESCILSLEGDDNIIWVMGNSGYSNHGKAIFDGNTMASTLMDGTPLIATWNRGSKTWVVLDGNGYWGSVGTITLYKKTSVVVSILKWILYIIFAILIIGAIIISLKILFNNINISKPLLIASIFSIIAIFVVVLYSQFYKNDEDNEQTSDTLMVSGSNMKQNQDNVKEEIIPVYSSTKQTEDSSKINDEIISTQTSNNELDTISEVEKSEYEKSIEMEYYEIVNVEKAYFYEMPDTNTRRKVYIVKGQEIKVTKQENEFIFGSFNNNGKITNGWLLKNDFQNK